MEHYIYDIRGSSGSGKSTLVRNILKRWSNEYIEDGKYQYHYIEKLNLAIIGKYIGKSTFDSSRLRKSEEQQEFIEKLAEKHNVLFENVMISHVFERWCELAKKHGNYRFFYLKVDEEECIKRVLNRRDKNDKTLKLENKNHRFFSTIQKTIDNLEKEGCWVKTIEGASPRGAYNIVVHQIKKDYYKQNSENTETVDKPKFCVFDIRGTNGSGKSTLVRNVLKRYDNELRLDEDIPYHYIKELNMCVLGRYDKRGSGVDNVKGSDRLQDFMRKKLKHHNVMLEGVIVSHVFERWDKMASEKGFDYVFFHLDVDQDECINRVRTRRENLGKDPDYDPKNTIRFKEATDRVIEKLEENGHCVIKIHNASKKEAYQILMKQVKRYVRKQEE